MKIRSAETNDKMTVLEFCKSTFSWGDYVADVWDSWQLKGGLYVLEYDCKVVGMYNIALFEKEAWVEGMRVHTQYRRKGFGKRMLVHAESRSRNKTIRLVIESENHPSIKLAESMGYYVEDNWQLYSMVPEKHHSYVETVNEISQTQGMVNSNTYVDSWKWLPLDDEELHKLIEQKRIVMSVLQGKTLAIAIWNRSSDFPQVLQIGYINGASHGMVDILRYIQNKAHELSCERIQVFALEKTFLEANFLDKKPLFYLMRKDPSSKNL